MISKRSWTDQIFNIFWHHKWSTGGFSTTTNTINVDAMFPFLGVQSTPSRRHIDVDRFIIYFMVTQKRHHLCYSWLFMYENQGFPGIYILIFKIYNAPLTLPLYTPTAVLLILKEILSHTWLLPDWCVSWCSARSLSLCSPKPRGCAPS